MKANEAPIKIWLSDEWVHQFDDKDFMGEDNSESTRTEAFIEKACKFLQDKGSAYITIIDGQLILRKCVVNDFKKYMKGEGV